MSLLPPKVCLDLCGILPADAIGKIAISPKASNSVSPPKMSGRDAFDIPDERRDRHLGPQADQ
jgi:hypothetical protein